MDKLNLRREPETIDATRDSTVLGSSRELAARYSQCSLCGSNLHFTYITDFARNVTQETARCPECSIRIRRVNHRLQ